MNGIILTPLYIRSIPAKEAMNRDGRKTGGLLHALGCPARRRGQYKWIRMILIIIFRIKGYPMQFGIKLNNPFNDRRFPCPRPAGQNQHRGMKRLENRVLLLLCVLHPDSFLKLAELKQELRFWKLFLISFLGHDSLQVRDDSLLREIQGRNIESFLFPDKLSFLGKLNHLVCDHFKGNFDLLTLLKQLLHAYKQWLCL